MRGTSDRRVVEELAPTGILRAGINMSNMLLVTGRTESGDPAGVAPDMAAEIARRLGVPIAYVKYEKPSVLAEAAGTGAWDIGLIGAEPARAEKIAFTAAYCEIEATYLVTGKLAVQDRGRGRSRGRSHLRQARHRLRSVARTQYQTRDRVAVEQPEGPLNQFVAEKLEAMASLRPALTRRRQKGARDQNPAR